MTDRTVPDEPPNDAFEWTAEPDDPDVAGMPGEFLAEPEPQPFDQESNN